MIFIGLLTGFNSEWITTFKTRSICKVICNAFLGEFQKARIFIGLLTGFNSEWITTFKTSSICKVICNDFLGEFPKARIFYKARKFAWPGLITS